MCGVVVIRKKLLAMSASAVTHWMERSLINNENIKMNKNHHPEVLDISLLSGIHGLLGPRTDAS